MNSILLPKKSNRPVQIPSVLTFNKALSGFLKFILILDLIIMVATSISGQNQIYNYLNTTGGAPSFVNDNVSASLLMRVNGAAQGSCGSSFNSVNFTGAGTWSAGLPAIEFTITPDPGYELTVTDMISANARQTSPAGPQEYRMAYSLDGTNWTTQGADQNSPNIASCLNTYVNATWNLTDFTTTSMVYFRVYAFAAATTTGHHYLKNIYINGSMFANFTPGCMDAAACNYNPNADTDDGSCTYPGCDDENACNFNTEAGCNDGSCIYPGCMDQEACNYDAGAGCDSGNCDYSCFGCTDEMACNYSPNAEIDDGSCDYSCYGCTDESACNYNPDATMDDDSCEYLSCLGCTDPLACNYDATATEDDGSCEYLTCLGCTDPLACNYDSDATIDDDSCDFSCYGCTDELACNYDSDATLDDGSCDYSCMGCTDSLATNYDSDATMDDGSCTYDFMICDCQGDEFSPSFRLLLGNDDPQDGTGAEPDFNCDTWGYDCGDINGAPTDDPYNVCDGNLPIMNGCIDAVDEIPSVAFTLFPNPSKGQFTISSNGQLGEMLIQLTDVTGKVVFTQNAVMSAQQAVQINVTQFTDGSYTMNIVGNGISEYMPVIIAH